MKNYNLIFAIIILILSIILKLIFDNLNEIKNLFNDSNKEAFSDKFFNICEGKKTYMYNLNTPLLDTLTKPNGDSVLKYHEISGSNLNIECKQKCIDNSCQMYLIRDDLHNFGTSYSCITYSPNLDGSGIDNYMDVSINCDSNSIQSMPDYTLNYLYNGIGFVDHDYFFKNKSNFDYLDIYLNESRKTISNFKKIQDEVKRVHDIPDPTPDVSLSTYLDDFVKGYNDIGDFLGITKNNLSSYYLKNINDDPIYKYNLDPCNNTIGDKVYNNYYSYIDDLNKIFSKNTSLQSKIDTTKNSYNFTFLLYSILAFILIFSISLLVVYKAQPDLINDTTIILYFIGVFCILYFVQFYIKV